MGIAQCCTQVADAVQLSRRTMAKIKENLGWAFAYNLVGLPVAAGALLPKFGLMLNHAALELAVQGTLAVTEATKLPAALATDLVLGLMLNIGATFVA